MVLIDTHILFWFLNGDDRVGPGSRKFIERSAPVYFSAMSILELGIKGQKDLRLRPLEIYETAKNQGFEELPLEVSGLHGVIEKPLFPRHDPFDQALISQAQAHRLDFLTADQKLLSLGLDFVIDATR